MNHDYSHCLDYEKGVCPSSCFRAELVEDYRARHISVPVAWTHFKGTKECEVAQKRPTVVEYIERKAVRDALYDADAITMKGVRILNQFPSADVKPKKIGHWVKARGSWFTPGGDPVWECSECGKGRHTYGVEHGTYGAEIADGQWVSCPNCGADMREDINA